MTECGVTGDNAMRSVSSLYGLALLGFALAPWHVMAATPADPATPPAQPSAAQAPGSAADVGGQVDGLGKRVDTATLGSLSGGSGSTQQITLNGTVSDTHSDNVLTGSNAISTGSFDGATGVPMVIQNTGNGVLIQNATIISVKLQP
jgi:hypothetical protein